MGLIKCLVIVDNNLVCTISIGLCLIFSIIHALDINEKTWQHQPNHIYQILVLNTKIIISVYSGHQKMFTINKRCSVVKATCSINIIVTLKWLFQTLPLAFIYYSIFSFSSGTLNYSLSYSHNWLQKDDFTPFHLKLSYQIWSFVYKWQEHDPKYTLYKVTPSDL